MPKLKNILDRSSSSWTEPSLCSVRSCLLLLGASRTIFCILPTCLIVRHFFMFCGLSFSFRINFYVALSSNRKLHQEFFRMVYNFLIDICSKRWQKILPLFCPATCHLYIFTFWHKLRATYGI